MRLGPGPPVRFLARHWRKVALVLLTATGAAAVVLVPPLQARASSVWKQALNWAGLVETTPESGTVYWCPMHPQVRRKKPNTPCPVCNMALVELEGGDREPPEHLTLTPRQVQQAGLEYEPVLRRTLHREIKTTGHIDYDERRLARITSWIEGQTRIEKLHINFTGTRVEKGELMAELFNADLIGTQEEYLLAQQSNSQYSEDTAEAVRQKLLDQGLTPEQVDRLARTGEVQDHIPISAPLSGTVIQRHVQEGQYVHEGETLFEVADLSHLWLFADVYEEELPLVHEGQQAQIAVRSYPEKTFEGTVSFIDPVVQRETRTVQVRIEIDNEDRLLKPGMYAQVTLRKKLGKKLAVPANAVLRSGEREVVLVRQGEGIFQPREIRTAATWAYPSETGYQPGGRLEFGADRVRYHPVLTGLHPGESVVTSGAFLLNAESQFQSVLTKMLPPERRSATLEQAVGEPIAKGIRNLLDAYYDLTRALAEDKLEDVPKAAGGFQGAARDLADRAGANGQEGLVSEAQRLAQLASGLTGEGPDDLEAARAGYGRISRTLVQFLVKNGGQTLFGEDLFLFRCGMAEVGYEKWLWWSDEIYNPYMGQKPRRGQKMLDCGSQLETLQP